MTICFADLDGADGLWVPEERTVLVNRGLSDAAVAEVIEHELAHVAIDDQHADLDAGREVIVGRPPSRRSGPLPVVLAAAAFVAVVGGVLFGVSKIGDRPGEQLVGPAPDGLTASEDGQVPQPDTTVVVTRDAQGRVITRTITITESAARPSATAGSLDPTPSATVPVQRTSAAAPVRPAPPGSSAQAPSPSLNEPSPTPSPTPTTPAPTPTPTPTDDVDPDPGDGGTGDGGIEDGGDAGDTAGTGLGDTTTGAVVGSASAGPASTDPTIDATG